MRKRKRVMDFINGNVNSKSSLSAQNKEDTLKQLNAQKLLDIGCGDGAFSLILKEAFGVQDVYGIEMAAQAAEIARNKGINVVCTNLNEADIPFDNEAFDMVFGGEIIEHLSDPDRFLGEIYRVLSPGGNCILTTPNLASWHSRLCLLLGWQPYSIPVSSNYRGAGAFLSRARNTRVTNVSYIDSDAKAGTGHIRFFTLLALKYLLKVHGFQIKRIVGSQAVVTFRIPFFLARIVGLIDKFTSLLFPSLASVIIIQATKV